MIIEMQAILFLHCTDFYTKKIQTATNRPDDLVLVSKV